MTAAEQKRELDKNYKRNFLSFMVEAFLFQFAITVFSTETVLPVYVAELSSETIFISLISVIYYGLLYVSAFFSCTVGVNAKSPKWISIKVCFLQRFGFFFFWGSTYLTGNRNLALVLFYVSLMMHTCANGMSTPLWNQLVATVINKKIGTFYGFYSMIGSASGIVASLVFTALLKSSSFPLNYRSLFALGLLCSLLATGVIAFGVKEVTVDREPAQLKMRDILPIIRDIYKTNHGFRRFSLIRIVAACAEFAVPYYILRASHSFGSPLGFAGILTTLFLLAKMLGSLVFGKISDRYGPKVMLQVSCVIGLLAALLAIPAVDYRVAACMYFLAGFAIQGVYLANGIASIVYSGGKNTPIYSAAIGILSSPVYIIVPLWGTFMATTFSESSVFIFAAVMYGFSLLLSLFLQRKKNVLPSEKG